MIVLTSVTSQERMGGAFFYIFFKSIYFMMSKKTNKSAVLGNKPQLQF